MRGGALLALGLLLATVLPASGQTAQGEFGSTRHACTITRL